MLNLTLRQLDYATAIARHGGLTPAALALNVSQPALSVALSQLEAELGQPLFLRRPRGLVPTAFGALWLAEAEAHLAGLGRLMRGQIRPPLRLGVFEDLAPATLAPLIVWAEAEGLAIEPRPFGFAALAEALEGGAVDAALGWALGLPGAAVSLRLASVVPQAVLAPDHPLATAGPLRLADLAAHPLVLTDQDLSVAHVQALFHAAGLSPRIAHRCASLDLMRSFAANGLGVGLSWTQPAPRLSHDGRPLVLRPLADVPGEEIVLRLGAPHAAAEPLARFLGKGLARMGG